MTPAARAVATDVEVSGENAGENKNGYEETDSRPTSIHHFYHIVSTSYSPRLLYLSLQARSFPSSARADVPPIPPLHTLAPAVQHALLVRDLLLSLSGVEVRTE